MLAQREFEATDSDLRDRSPHQHAVMLLEATLPVTLLIKLHVGGYSLYLWAHERLRGSPRGSVAQGTWNGGAAQEGRTQPARAGGNCCPLDQCTPRRLKGVPAEFVVSNSSNPFKLLHGRMEGRTGEEEEPLPPTQGAQEARKGQGSEGPRSPGRRKIQSSVKTQQRSEVRALTPCKGSKPRSYPSQSTGDHDTCCVTPSIFT